MDYESAASVVVHDNATLIDEIRSLSGDARERAIRIRLRRACEEYFWRHGDIEPIEAHVDWLLSNVRRQIRKAPKAT